MFHEHSAWRTNQFRSTGHANFENDIQTVGTKPSIAEQDGFRRADVFVFRAYGVIGYMYVLMYFALSCFR
jgi:hypothetical protein